MTTMFHLSSVIRRAIVDQAGDRIGRVQDLVARLGDDAHPPVVGAVVRVEGRDLFIPIRKIGGLEKGDVRFEGNRVDLRRFERRPGEVLLAADLLNRHVINLVHGRLVRGNEIELALVGDRWEVVAIDPSRRPMLRRLLQRVGLGIATGSVIDFASIEPFVSHVPSARLRIPYRKLSRLHPAQIADLVESASHDEGVEIIEAVGQDRELEADVFEELDTEHQLEFLEARSDSEAARMMSRMATDNAADLINEIDQERRLSILEKIAQPQQTKIRQLLEYNPDTAGGLMSPDFVHVHVTGTVEDALEAVRDSSAPAETLNVVFILGDEGNPLGAAPLAALVRAHGTDLALSLARTNLQCVRPTWDVHRVAGKMSDFNLTVVPVVAKKTNQMVGVVTVDDLLEEMLPQGWRREYGMTEVEGE